MCHRESSARCTREVTALSRGLRPPACRYNRKKTAAAVVRSSTNPIAVLQAFLIARSIIHINFACAIPGKNYCNSSKNTGSAAHMIQMHPGCGLESAQRSFPCGLLACHLLPSSKSEMRRLFETAQPEDRGCGWRTPNREPRA